MEISHTNKFNTANNLQNPNTKDISDACFYGYKTSAINYSSSDITVVGNVYGHGSSQITSGFGDVAHAARAVKVLRAEFPDRSLKLIVEGSYDESCKENNNYQIFKKITSIPSVETILINNHKDNMNKSQTNQEVKEHLRNTKVIVHGPADTISLIYDNPSDFSGKTIYFDEYNCTSLYNIERYPGIDYLGTGFPCSRNPSGMFLKEMDINQSEFENKFFQNHIKPTDKTSFYFCYHNKPRSLKSSIILFSILESSYDQDITIVSSCSEKKVKKQLQQKEIDDIWKEISDDSDNPVKKIRLISSMGMEREWVNGCLPENSMGKTVTILIPNGFSPNDAFLLGKHAKCTVSSGDLSMSDIFAAGRIPITAIDGKGDNARAMYSHLKGFSREHPQYKEQVGCMETLMCAMENLAGKEKSARDIACESKLFGTHEWSEFEQSYLDYLRSQPGVFLEENLCSAVKRKLETNQIHHNCR